MAGKSLRAQLNQIRAWVQEGRTDAWIAHQLEVSASELRDFRKRHELSSEGGGDDADGLRDEIEAEVEAATLEEAEREPEEDESEGSEKDSDPGDSDEDSDDDGDGEGRGRRRRRRGGRGRKRGGKKLEATFDHGTDDGYGLWLDAAVKDDPTYKEHWKDQRAVEVSIEADQIVIRRA